MDRKLTHKICAVVLAAGKAVRMGEQKLLLPFGDTTVLDNVLQCVTALNLFWKIIMVYSSSEVGEAADKYGAEKILNSCPELGLSSSIKLGVEAADGADAYMFFSGDQPLLNTAVIGRLVRKYEEYSNHIVVPIYSDNKGTPTIFPAAWEKALLELEGDVGGRTIIKNNSDRVKLVLISQSIAGFDIDTREDYAEALKLRANK